MHCVRLTFSALPVPHLPSSSPVKWYSFRSVLPLLSSCSVCHTAIFLFFPACRAAVCEGGGWTGDGKGEEEGD